MICLVACMDILQLFTLSIIVLFTGNVNLGFECKKMSTSFFERLKAINEQTNIVVSGYLRENEANIFGELIESNPFYNFPKLLHTICLLYYAFLDEWDPEQIGKWHKLSDNGFCIENVGPSRFCSSYGKLVAKSPGIYRWRFKLVNVPVLSYSYWAIILGVWKTQSADKPPVHTHHASTGNRKGQYLWGYGFDVMNGTLVDAPGSNAKEGGDYGKKCVTGDIIEIELDLKVEFTIRFNINGEQGKIAHNVEDTEYRVALSTYYIGPIVEMLP